MHHFITLLLCLCALATPSCKDSILAPKNDDARILRINETFEAGDYETALTKAEQYVDDYPESGDGWTLLGWSYCKTDQLEKAEESFDKALELNPRQDNAYVGKGVVARKKDDLDAATKAYLKAIEILPANAEAYASLLVIELLRENDEQAVKYGELAWSIRKDMPVIPANLCIAYHLVGNHAKRDMFRKEAKRLGYHSMDALNDIIEGKTSFR